VVGFIYLYLGYHYENFERLGRCLLIFQFWGVDQYPYSDFGDAGYVLAEVLV